jgi:hypothetical protein
VNTEEITPTLIAKLSIILERDVTKMEEAIVEWVIAQIHLDQLQQEQV